MSTGWLDGYPAVAVAIGALCVSASSVLIDLARTTPGTASFYRCVLALPFLVLPALAERRREGVPARGQHVVAAVAGALFAGDMLLWTQAIAEVGAGLSTVLVNVQVILVPLLALMIDREKVTRRFVLILPVVVAGVVLTGGLLGGSQGRDPLWGTIHAVLAAVCYSGFLFLLRRSGHEGRAVQSYLEVTVWAAIVSLVAGVAWQGVEWAPGWATVGWLAGVALFGQVLGWLLVAVWSPRLPSYLGAILLLLTPVGSVALGALVLGERPTMPQLAGCALILAGACVAGIRAPATNQADDADSSRDAARRA
ncbi:DMT family transporter [Nonomuraea sp. NPDC049695]|uniref:DMT family transporter n=1 Tax=Nonomuraea sp. NPDC049695 TaxID=3154734 RepID=UPI00341A6F89